MAPGTLTLRTTCTGGINQNPERCRDNQVADALNVWAPNGRLEQRPGCYGIAGDAIYTTTRTGNGTILCEDVSAGTFSNLAAAVAGLEARDDDAGTIGDRIYIGHTVATGDAGAYYSLVNNAMPATIRLEKEYWNGSSWVRIYARPISTNIGGRPLTQRDEHYFPRPGDWALSTLTDTATGTAYSRYWIRLTLVSVDPSPGGVVSVPAGTTIEVPGYIANARALAAQQTAPCVLGPARCVFPTQKQYVFACNLAATAFNVFYVHSALSSRSSYVFQQFPADSAYLQAEWALSVAVVPQFGESFVAFGGWVGEFDAGAVAGTVVSAQVEDRDFAVGPGAPWDKTTIAQLTSFPAAKFILFFQNRLWVVDKNDNLRWSAAAPYHKVWPGLAFAPVIEDDQSPVTGLQGLGESPVVYKNDSIWVASYSAIDAFDIPQYTPRKVVSGVGCVANGSIKSIKGRHIFLGENGIYSFDGSTAPLLTQDPETGVDRLRDFWPRINSGRRRWAAAAHWRSKHCYLLSVSTDGANYNNTTVCWDYVNDAWWLWEGFDAQCWIEDEDEQDNEAMYFSDSYGQVYRFGVADHDHGATIEAYALTRRLGYGDSLRKTLRQLDICADNTVQSLTVTTTANGSPAQFGKTKTLDFTSRNETRLGVEGWTLSGVGTRLMAALARIRQRDTSVTCDFVQVKLAGAGRGKPLRVNYVQAKFLGHPGRAR